MKPDGLADGAHPMRGPLSEWRAGKAALRLVAAGRVSDARLLTKRQIGHRKAAQRPGWLDGLLEVMDLCCSDEGAPPDIAAKTDLGLKLVPQARAILRALEKGGRTGGQVYPILLASIPFSKASSLALSRRYAICAESLVSEGRVETALRLVQRGPDEVLHRARAALEGPLTKAAVEMVTPQAPDALQTWADQFPASPRAQSFRRIAQVMAEEPDARLLVEDKPAVTALFRPPRIYKNLSEPPLARLICEAGRVFPTDAPLLRHLQRHYREVRDYPNALAIAQRLTRLPNPIASDFFYRFRMMNQFGRGPAVRRYARMLKGAHDRGAGSPVELAKRLWATGDHSAALDTLGRIKNWHNDVVALEIGLRALIKVRRFHDAEALLARSSHKTALKGLRTQVTGAVERLREMGVQPAPGEDSALALVRHWVDQAAIRKAPLYSPVPKRAVISSFSLGIGGAERQTAELVRVLSEDETAESVKLLLFSQTPQTYHLAARPERATIHFANDLAGPVAEDGRIASLVAEAEALGALFGLAQVPRALRAVWALRPEVVHVRSGLPLEVALAALICGAPKIVVHFGSMTRSHQSTGSEEEQMREKLVECGIAYIKRHADIHLAANSRAAADEWADAMNTPRESIGVIHNAIGEAEVTFGAIAAPPALSGQSPVVGGVFRFAVVKDPILWVDVAACVAKARPAVSFLLVGDGPMRGDVEQRIRQHRLQGRFELPGLITEGMEPYLARMDVSLMTTTTESLPNSVIEAQLAGRPVIAPDVGGVSEAVAGPDTAVLTARTLDALAQAVITVLDDEAWRRAVWRRAPGLVHAKFSSAALLAAVKRAYGW